MPILPVSTPNTIDTYRHITITTTIGKRIINLMRIKLETYMNIMFIRIAIGLILLVLGILEMLDLEGQYTFSKLDILNAKIIHQLAAIILLFFGRIIII